jgi:hypothetical protein
MGGMVRYSVGGNCWSESAGVTYEGINCRIMPLSHCQCPDSVVLRRAVTGPGSATSAATPNPPSHRYLRTEYASLAPQGPRPTALYLG